MRIVGCIALVVHDHAFTGYHYQKSLVSVIQGLTRNPVFRSGFPLSRE